MVVPTGPSTFQGCTPNDPVEAGRYCVDYVYDAGRHTDIARVTEGRLFPKIGGEAVYVVGVRGADRALAVKIDDGSLRGMHALVVDLLERFELITAAEAEALGDWREGVLRNWAKLDIGRVEVVG